MLEILNGRPNISTPEEILSVCRDKNIGGFNKNEKYIEPEILKSWLKDHIALRKSKKEDSPSPDYSESHQFKIEDDTPSYWRKGER